MDQQPEQADYRFLLANERTFLAWVRTALSLQIAGLGVLQFLTHGHEPCATPSASAWWPSGSYVGRPATGATTTTTRRSEPAGPDHVRSSAFVATAVIVLPCRGARSRAGRMY